MNGLSRHSSSISSRHSHRRSCNPAHRHPASHPTEAVTTTCSGLPLAALLGDPTAFSVPPEALVTRTSKGSSLRRRYHRGDRCPTRSLVIVPMRPLVVSPSKAHPCYEHHGVHLYRRPIAVWRCL